MKITTHVWLAGIVLSGMFSSALAQNSIVQSSSPAPETPLGDYARAQRQNKKAQAAKQFDNDTLPKNDKLSVVGDSKDASAAPAADPDKTEAANAAPQNAAVKPGQSQEEMQGVYDEWQQRISGQHAQIDLLSRELDVAQREYRLRAAAVYGDAGDRLRNSANWDKEDADYKQKIADKQKAVDDAKQKLDQMQEDARKSGVPSSVREAAEQPKEQSPDKAQP